MPIVINPHEWVVMINVVMIAIAMPITPKAKPVLAVSGPDRPRKAIIKQIDEVK